eukprot:7219711-Alexandrium_andersonii.AAC.1
MSASLVGSEMCIRDRDKRALAFASSAGHGPGASSERTGRGAAEGACRKAVSYTHLTLPTICSV